jgi:uncharacterized membrane protein YfcA
VSNTVGLVPGNISGAYAYRKELTGRGALLLQLGTAALLGGVTGAVLLLVLPAVAFRMIVPAFIAAALILVILQPRLARRWAQRSNAVAGTESGSRFGPLVLLGSFGAGLYGGYFGAAQGVLVLGVLGTTFLGADLQRLNGIKNVLTTGVNGVAATVFILFADVAWRPALLIAVGSIAGGYLGAHFGRRLPSRVLCAAIVVMGLVAIVHVLSRSIGA